MKAAYRKNSHVMALTDDQLKGLGIVSPVPLGQWNSAIKYQKLNIVRYNGASYIARTSNINVEPTVSPIWQNVWMAVAYDGGSISPDGTYPEMTVGNATNAQSATKATQDGNGNNIVDTYARQNGTYGSMSVGNATNAENATKATQDGDGNIIPDTYAKQSGTYPNMTVGNATKATQDGNGNNIVHTYPKIQTFLWDYDSYGQYLQTGVSGSIFIYNCGGNTGIVVINIKISPALQPYTSKLIMLFDLLPDAVKCATGDGIQSVVTYRTNDAWMQPAILDVSSEGIYIRAQAHATQADEYIRGFCVYPTTKSIE